MSKMNVYLEVPFHEERIFGMESYQTAMMKWERQLHMQCYHINFYGSNVRISRRDSDLTTVLYFTTVENHVQFVGGI